MFNHRKRPFFLAALLATTLLTACTSPVGPQASGIAPPPAWSRLDSPSPTAPSHIADVPLATSADREVDHRWWTHFDDPTLDTLIGEALTNNKTLQIAK